MHRIRFIGLLLFFTSLVFLTACGGGGGSADGTGASTVSGVAATGAPVYGTVTIKDRNGVQRGSVTTDEDGKFSIDVTGLAPPFLLKVDGLANNLPTTLYSVTTGTGTAHITPFSNLALHLVTGADPATVFGADGIPPDTSRIDGVRLQNALEKIKTLLAPLLAEYGITDFEPIGGAYSATPGNRLDAMLDVIGLTVDKGVLTIFNKLTGAVIASGNLTELGTMAVALEKCPRPSTLTDIKELTDRLVVLRDVMNKGDALTLLDLEELFIPDPFYGTSNGNTRAQDMASIVTIFGPNGTNPNGKLRSIRNVRLVSDQTENYSGRGVTRAYLISYDFIHENGTVVHSTKTTWGLDTGSGQWKFIGDPANVVIGSNYGAVFYLVTGLDNGFMVSEDIITFEYSVDISPQNEVVDRIDNDQVATITSPSP